MKPIILASISPRRSVLLRQLGLPFEVQPSRAPEVTSGRPEEAAVASSKAKARDVADRRKRGIIIAADTIVVLGSEVLGKPKDAAQAQEMLGRLSGRWHEVVTGITVIEAPEGKTVSGYERTRVLVRGLTEEEIAGYVATGEPLDKAGAYGAQGLGAVIVERIEGDYFNVVGLPVAKLAMILAEFGIEVLVRGRQ